MQEVPAQLLDGARENGIVVTAGAGMSAVPPSCLPDWHRLNEMIVDALCHRFERYVEKPGYTKDVGDVIHARRSANRFPPDYQAQILAQTCGDRYFRALQSLDVTTTNDAHDGIARLARHGVIRAIVTTNFDRLIEQALDEAGVAFESAYEPVGYQRCAQTLVNRAEDDPLPILKIHGSVEDPASMVDTLQQRRLGRNLHLQQCLSTLLQSHFWLYLGFSAADLETDEDYLGIVSAAERSPGLVYLQWPGAKVLGDGAQRMISAYGTRAAVVVAEMDAFLGSFADSVNAPAMDPAVRAEGDTTEQVTQALDGWASHLHPADTVVCLAGMAEAAGESGAAFDMLHRFWNDVRPKERRGPAFERYRLTHGRLGMGTGLLSTVEDLNSNRGMESLQDLFRAAEHDPRGSVWGGLALVWGGQIALGLGNMKRAEKIFTDEKTTPEWKVDAWLAIAEAGCLTAGLDTEFLESWGTANHWADQSGDLARQARVAAWHSLLMAEFWPEMYDAFVAEYALPVLQQARRLHDSGIDGFEALARGRAATKRRDTETALDALQAAIDSLNRAGRYPWCVYAEIESAWALIDNGRLDESADQLDHINKHIDRYQVLLPRYEEARGMHHRLIGREDIARTAFEDAVKYAQKMELNYLVERYRQYLD